ncbi:MAG: addiction module protein [Thermoleophilia bacterium]
MKEIIEEAELRTINPPSAEFEIEWMMIASRRLAELRSGHAQAAPGSEVFDRIHSRWKNRG